MFLTEERVQTELNKSIRRPGVPLNESVSMTAEEDKDFAYMVECFAQANKDAPLSESASFQKKNAIMMLSKGSATVIFAKNASKFEALVLDKGKAGDRQVFKNSLEMDEYAHELQSNGYKVQKKDGMVKVIKKYAYKIGKVILKIGLISVIAVALLIFIKWIVAVYFVGVSSGGIGAVSVATMKTLGVTQFTSTMTSIGSGWSTIVAVMSGTEAIGVVGIGAGGSLVAGATRKVTGIGKKK